MLVAFGSSNDAQGAFLFAAGLYALPAGIGLLQLRSWARSMAIGGYVLNIVAGFAQPNPTAAIVAGLLLGYLCSAKVKAAFSPHILTSAPAPAPTV